MNGNDIVFLMDAFRIKKGGLTKAVTSRANLLAAKKERLFYLTLTFNPVHQSTVQEAKSTGLLYSNIEILNLFDEMAEKSAQEVSETITRDSNIDANEEGFVITESISDEHDAYRYYKDGIYVKYKRFRKDGTIVYIDYMNEARQRTIREEFSHDNTLLRTRHYNVANGKPRLDRYFNKNGYCYLTIWVNEEKDQPGKCIHFPSGKEHGKFEDLAVEWIKEKFKEYSMKDPIVTVDQRPLDNIVFRLPAKKTAVMHSNHLAAPFNDISKINSGYDDFFKKMDHFDDVVILTHEQKNDIEEHFGRLTNYHVIPHSVPDANLSDNPNYHQKKVITIGRLVKDKGVDESLRAFRKVVDQIPDAQLDIYGVGKEEKSLRNLMKELNLEKNVAFKGYTLDPLPKYQEAAVSLLTSRAEGFGLVITESLSVGTPMVLFDVKYGPKDIIRNGLDGVLVEHGDIDQLAKVLIDLLSDQQKLTEMRVKAKEVSQRFSVENFQDSWLSIIEA
jgi:glycosyltransferase involved in cell wall biosynthesis